MPTVSVNAFDDGELLRGCLESIRERLPHARIQVVDGRYEAFPAPADNSTDDTPAVCDAYGAEYWPDGPFEDEPAKHWQRIDRAPDGEPLLFMDADERLVAFDDSPLDGEVGAVRVHNAACYNGDFTYYARYFEPQWMADIPRVDRYWFGQDRTEQRIDAITITHRADLRGEAYRDAKARRLRADGRDWYDAYLDELEADGLDLDFEACPNCGRESLARTKITGFGLDSDFSRVETCVAADRCHAAVVPVDGPDLPDDFEYVPDDLDRGFAEDPERVRMELMAAGNPIARVVAGEAFERYEPNAKLWVEHEYLGDGLSRAK